MEYDIQLDSVVKTDPVLDTINLIVVVFINIGCLYGAIFNWYWWVKLRVSTTTLRPYVLGVALAKTFLFFFSCGWLAQILVFDMTQPAMMFPFRLGLMVAVLAQAWASIKFNPPLSHGDGVGGPLEH